VNKRKEPWVVRSFFRAVRKAKKILFGRSERWHWSTDREYWESHYSSGGASGEGSVGDSREAKWRFISEYVDVRDKTVLDVGCGDLSFWEGKDCRSYTGIDFSESVVEKDRTIRPSWRFIAGDASADHHVSGQVVLCLDMLFHIMSDDSYRRVLANLAHWTEEWLFIFTWFRSPFGRRATDGRYQYYRPLLESLDVLAPLTLVRTRQYDSIGALYVFKRP